MQIERVTLTEEEVNQIFDKLIEGFDPQYCASVANGQEINFTLNNQIEVWATLDLNVEYTEFDSNHQCNPIDVTVKFTIDLFNNGQSVEGLEKTNIEDRVTGYNWIQYF